MNNFTKSILTYTGLTLVSSYAFAEIPEIDSSGWSTDPKQYGMTAGEYINAESNFFMANFIKRAGLNHFFHFQGLSTAKDTWVVSPNNDTIYSMATVNASKGFTLKLPDVGDRFLSAQIVTQDHMISDPYLWRWHV